VGRPLDTNILTSVKPADLRVWHERLQTLADPHLRVEVLSAETAASRSCSRD
jgi:hypothetical protein